MRPNGHEVRYQRRIPAHCDDYGVSGHATDERTQNDTRHQPVRRDVLGRPDVQGALRSDRISCPAFGAPGTVFGYPACVYGFFMYVTIAVISALGLRALRGRHASDASRTTTPAHS